MSLLDRDGDGWISATENPLSTINRQGSDSVLNDLMSKNGSQTASDMINFDYSDLNAWMDELYRKYQSGDEAAGERLFNEVAQSFAEKTSRDWTASREDTAYQRLVQDLKKAGISPYVLSGASPFASAASFSSRSGSQMTSQANSRRSAEQDALDRTVDNKRVMAQFASSALMALAFALKVFVAR